MAFDEFKVGYDEDDDEDGGDGDDGWDDDN